MNLLERIKSSLSFNKHRRLPGSAARVTPDAVFWAYRLFLGREPENNVVVAEKVRRLTSIHQLREEMLRSTEFAQFAGFDQPNLRDGSDPPMDIELKVSEQVLNDLFSHIQGVWQYLGETEPHWSVLSAEPFLQQNIECNLDAFYLSGNEDVNRILATLERNRVDFSRFKTCIDYGCGLGHVTRWLAD